MANQSTKRKTTAKKTTSRKRTNTSQAKRKAEAQKINSCILINMVLTILFSVFMYIVPLSGAGGIIKAFLLGLIGNIAYVLPVLSFILTGYIIKRKDVDKFKIKLLLSTIIVFLASALYHLPSVGFIDISTAYTCASSGMGGGGVIGALLACPLAGAISAIATGVIYTALLIVCVCIATKKSLISAVSSFFEGFSQEVEEIEEIDASELGKKTKTVVHNNVQKVRNTNLKPLKQKTIDFPISDDLTFEEKKEEQPKKKKMPFWKKSAEPKLPDIKPIAETSKAMDNFDIEEDSTSYNVHTDKNSEIDDIVSADELEIISDGNVTKIDYPELAYDYDKDFNDDEFNVEDVKYVSIYDENDDAVEEETEVQNEVTDEEKEIQSELSKKEESDDIAAEPVAEFVRNTSAEAAAEQAEIKAEPISFENEAVEEEIEENEVFDDNFGLEQVEEDIIEENPENTNVQNAENYKISVPEQPKMTAAPVFNISDNQQADTERDFAKEYVFPKVDLLSKPKKPSMDLRYEMQQNSIKMVEIFKNFGVGVKVLQVTQGPTVTRYEIQPDVGVKLSKITGLADDLALNLAVSGVLIAPVPGKPVIGVEVPNKEVGSVYVRELIDSDDFKNSKSKLSVALGKDIGGRIVVGDIAKMPHVLIAGATGSGKSVCINTIITSILYKARPDEVKLIMIDPKVVELGIYNGIPHLLVPVVTDPKRASGALSWAVTEMMKRYDMFASNRVRNIVGYNQFAEKNGLEKMPQIVIIIDELADLMMVAAKEVEDRICRLAQLARAAGIHLIIATQRPSVDVITGLIKANVPSRIAFAVSSQVDSRTILDKGGAEKLLGKGDMLYHPTGMSSPLRVQGAFVSDEEIENIVEFLKENTEPTSYSEDLAEHIERCSDGETGHEPDVQDDGDKLLPNAIELALKNGQISTSMVQRRLNVGYARAGRIIDQMESRGIISGADGSKPRQVLVSRNELMG